MEKLIAITQEKDGGFYAALIVNAEGHIEGYDLFKINGDTCKHQSGDGYCELNKKNTIKIPNSSMEGNVVWIADGYNHEIAKKECKKCIPPTIITGRSPISQGEWEGMIETDSSYNEVDYNLEDEDDNIIEDENVIEKFINCLENGNIEFADYDISGGNICIRHLRNEDGYTFQDKKIEEALIKFREETNLEVSIIFNDEIN